MPFTKEQIIRIVPAVMTVFLKKAMPALKIVLHVIHYRAAPVSAV
jgi:hypothetical protein